MPTEYKTDNIVKVIKKSQINEVGEGEMFVVIDDAQVVDDAPNDGKIYGRKDGAWVEIVVELSETTED